MFNDYPERTRYDKRARNYRYLYDFDFSKYHWNDLPLKERDYWRGLVQIDLDEQSRFKKKKAQRTQESRIDKAKK